MGLPSTPVFDCIQFLTHIMSIVVSFQALFFSYLFQAFVCQKNTDCWLCADGFQQDYRYEYQREIHVKCALKEKYARINI